MEAGELLEETGRAVEVLGLVLLPLLIPMLVVGLIIGIVQAATSINEQTLSFVPKLLILGLSLVLFGGLVIVLLTDFTAEIFALISKAGR